MGTDCVLNDPLLGRSNSRCHGGGSASDLEAGGSPPTSVRCWGVIASSRFLGRDPVRAALNRFRSEGVWGVSPHLIPHYALHSPAGTLSLVLGTHGSSLGTGGGLFSATEGLLTALTLLTGRTVPGVWFVTTGWHPELCPENEDQPSAESECQALALGLVAGSSSSSVNREAISASRRGVFAADRPPTHRCYPTGQTPRRRSSTARLGGIVWPQDPVSHAAFRSGNHRTAL